jgi:replicative DNA helicase
MDMPDTREAGLLPDGGEGRFGAPGGTTRQSGGLSSSPEGLRSIPANLEAEEAILGSLLIDPDAIIKIAATLSAEDFYREKNGWIYQAILDLHEKREPADFVTLCDEMERRNQLQEVGGAGYITQLINNTPTAVHVEYYAGIVERTATLRRLIGAAGQITALAYDEAQDVDEVVDRAEQLVFGVSERRIRRDLTPIRHIMGNVVERIDYLHRHTGDLLGVPSGFGKLDKVLGGFQKSDLVILAARPSVGKCIVSGSRLLDPETGRLVVIDDIVDRRQGSLLTLDEHYRLRQTRAADFVDDGIKPVYRVRTGLGREIVTTASHPFLTIGGWRPLMALPPGQRVAVPRALPYFGTREISQAQAKLLGYLLGDGCLTKACPEFTNENPRLQADFAQAANSFAGVTTRSFDSNGTRTTSLRVSGDPEFIACNWKRFRLNLRQALGAYPHTARHLAQEVGVTPGLVSMWQSGDCVPQTRTFDRVCQQLHVVGSQLAPHGLPAISRNSQNSLTIWLAELGLMGKDAHAKFVPPLVFELTRPLVALFLNRLFACDGSIYLGRDTNPQICYSTVSLALARDVQHLLLRFGILAKLRHRQVRYRQSQRPAYEIIITGKDDLLHFLDHVGAFGKESQAERVRTRCAEIEPRSDTVPTEIWDRILALKGELPWAEVSRRLGYSSTNNFHVRRPAPSRDRLLQFGRVFGDEALSDLAQSDLYWDTIESIEYIGERQVYDLTVDETHNFVAEDMLVHNTALALNFAANAAKKYAQRVAFFSLEMSAEQLVQRLLSSETGINQQRLRLGDVKEEEWLMLMEAAGVLSETLLFIDDTPAVSALELRTKARRLQAEHGLDLVIVDYLQLMRGEGGRNDNRVQEISYITRSLKGLARELEVPLIALSQLSRAVEQRTDHKPQLSDLRESGSIEQDADVVMFIYREDMVKEDSERKNIADVIVAKHRNGPTDTVPLFFNRELTKFADLEMTRSPLDYGA